MPISLKELINTHIYCKTQLYTILHIDVAFFQICIFYVWFMQTYCIYLILLECFALNYKPIMECIYRKIMVNTRTSRDKFFLLILYQWINLTIIEFAMNYN